VCRIAHPILTVNPLPDFFSAPKNSKHFPIKCKLKTTQKVKLNNFTKNVFFLYFVANFCSCPFRLYTGHTGSDAK
jgi:hypothetical protein